MITVNGSLTIQDVVAVARDEERVRLASEAVDRMANSRKAVDDIVNSDDRRVYGVNTGYGELNDKEISPEMMTQHEENVIRSNITIGDPLETDVVRATMLVRANAFAVGRSGVRPVVAERLLELLNAGIHPIVRSQGNTEDYGYSSAVGRALIGEGEVTYKDETMSAGEALSKEGIDSLSLQPREGLALMSGTSYTPGRLALLVKDVRRLVEAADVAGALSFSLVGKEPGAFSSRIGEVRPYEGFKESASIIREVTGIDATNRRQTSQDPLSLRCMPQVHGSLREFLATAESLIRTELQSATDNPLIFPDGAVFSCGNFNAQHLSTAADSLAQSVTKVGRISERRAGLLVEGNGDLPSALTDNVGIGQGMVRAHYSAASLAAEASTVDTASTQIADVPMGKEDIQGLGALAVNNLASVVETVTYIIAIELLFIIRAHKMLQKQRDTDSTIPRDFLAELDRDTVEPDNECIHAIAERILDGTLHRVRDNSNKV